MYVNFNKKTKAFLTLFLSGMLMVLSVSAQTGATINVRGTVQDVAGEPIIGANILIQGTTTGTITDYDGNFMIQVPSDAILEVSYIGYVPQTIPVNNRTTINIILQEDTELLDEVVVIGYGSVRKDDATGSVVAVDATSLNKGLATNPSDMLAGKVAGLSIISSGGAPNEPARKELHDTYKTLINLRIEHPELFNSTATFDWKVTPTYWDQGRFMTLSSFGNSKQVVVVGNFTNGTITATTVFPSTGIWYNYMEPAETLNVDSKTMNIEIPANSFRIYSTFGE